MTRAERFGKPPGIAKRRTSAVCVVPITVSPPRPYVPQPRRFEWWYRWLRSVGAKLMHAGRVY